MHIHMKRWGVLGLAMALGVGVTLAAFHPVFAGTSRVTVSGIVTEKTTTALTVKPTSADAVTFVVTSSTKMVGRSSEKETYSLLSVGDSVTVRGTKTTSTVNDSTVTSYLAQTINDKSLWRAAITGKISELDVEEKTFTLTFRSRVPGLGTYASYSFENSGNVLTKIYQTTVSKSGKKVTRVTSTKAWTDLSNGLTVTVSGLWNLAQEHMTDSRIVMPVKDYSRIGTPVLKQ